MYLLALKRWSWHCSMASRLSSQFVRWRAGSTSHLPDYHIYASHISAAARSTCVVGGPTGGYTTTRKFSHAIRTTHVQCTPHSSHVYTLSTCAAVQTGRIVCHARPCVRLSARYGLLTREEKAVQQPNLVRMLPREGATGVPVFS